MCIQTTICKVDFPNNEHKQKRMYFNYLKKGIYFTKTENFIVLLSVSFSIHLYIMAWLEFQTLNSNLPGDGISIKNTWCIWTTMSI